MIVACLSLLRSMVVEELVRCYTIDQPREWLGNECKIMQALQVVQTGYKKSCIFV